MATTYTLISSVTVGSGGAANITFSSIPSTYTDLKIVLSARSDRASVQDTAAIRFNGTNSNLSMRRLYADGTSVYSDNAATFIPTGHFSANSATANTFGNVEIYIPNYTSSNNKSISSDGAAETNATDVFRSMVAGLWSSSAAITSIGLYPNDGSNNFMQYSTAYLYGISNA
jgi:hypothetical protein